MGSSTGTYVIPAREHSLDFLKVGQSFATEGIQVSVVATGDNDQIKIEKLP
jgi:Tfp pilus assembly PilM family ATPase